jgi:hypothetical protein
MITANARPLSAAAQALVDLVSERYPELPRAEHLGVGTAPS